MTTSNSRDGKVEANCCTSASRLAHHRCGCGVLMLQPYEYPQPQAFPRPQRRFDKSVQLILLVRKEMEYGPPGGPRKSTRTCPGNSCDVRGVLRKHPSPERHEPILDACHPVFVRWRLRRPGTAHWWRRGGGRFRCRLLRRYGRDSG